MSELCSNLDGRVIRRGVFRKIETAKKDAASTAPDPLLEHAPLARTIGTRFNSLSNSLPETLYE